MAKRRDGKRWDDVFIVLKVIRRIVDADIQEASAAAVKGPTRDRQHVDALRAAILSEDATRGADLVSFVETIELTVREFHSLSHFLISERETLGKALEAIRQELELVDIPPRIDNLGSGARGADQEAE